MGVRPQPQERGDPEIGIQVDSTLGSVLNTPLSGAVRDRCFRNSVDFILAWNSTGHLTAPGSVLQGRDPDLGLEGTDLSPRGPTPHQHHSEKSAWLPALTPNGIDNEVPFAVPRGPGTAGLN